MGFKVIDVSSYQGKPYWAAVAADGIKGAVIRIMKKSGIDGSFEHNYSGCGENGIARGVYRYCYALTVAQAETEALEVVSVLGGRRLEMGVYIDLEWSTQRQLGRAKVKEIADAWMRIIRDAGYECNVYCNLDWYKNVCGGLDARYWIARYPASDTGAIKESLRPNVGEMGWQYSSKGSVAGISGNVDLNDWYSDPMAGAETKEEKEPGVIYTVSVADVWTREEAEKLQKQYAAMGIAGVVHKCKIIG